MLVVILQYKTTNIPYSKNIYVRIKIFHDWFG